MRLPAERLQKHYLPVLILLSILILTAGLNGYSLRGSTEPREAGVAAHMLQESQYVLPSLNGRPFLEKPPLSYWLQDAAISLFGYKPAAARLPSVGAALLCLVMVFFRVKKLCGRAESAFFSAMLLLTMASFWMNARTAGQDALLACGVALTLLSFNAARSQARNSWAWLGYAIGIAVSTLSKGVIGLAVPGIVILSFLLIETFAIERRFILGNWLRPAMYATAGLVPLALWLYMLAQHNGSAAVRDILWSNSIERFSGDYAFGSHAEPFYYYLKKLPETFAPWNMLVFFSVWQLRGQWRDKNVLFFICWLLAPYVLLSLSAGKRPPYLLMLYPSAAVLVALFFDQVWSNRVVTKSLRIALLIQVFLLFAVSVFLIAHAWKLHVRGAALSLLLALVIALVVARHEWLNRAWSRLVVCVFLLVILCYITLGTVLLKHDSKRESLAAIFLQMQTLEQQGHSLLLFKPIERIEGATNFYLGHSLPEVEDSQELQNKLNASKSVVALVAMSDVGQVRDYRVIADYVEEKRKYLLISGAR